MKYIRIFKKHMSFILCCVLFAVICVFGSAAAFADYQDSENTPAAALFDRNGAALTEDTFPYYKAALDTFTEYLSAGKGVKLTIDLQLQDKAQAILDENLAAHGEYAAGCLVVLDIKSGEPLALVSSGEGADPLNSTYTPHQLFTPVTALAALNWDIVDTDTRIACEGVFTRYENEGIAPECWICQYGLTHPEQDMITAMRDSCYYYFYCLGNDLGIDALEEYARSLGLGEMTGIELPSSQGIMASRDRKPYGQPWNIGDTLDASIGGSVSAFTPLQLAQYCATIANNGQRYSASILREISDGDGKLSYVRQPRLISQTPEMEEEKWTAVKEGMYHKLNDPASSYSAWQVAGLSSLSSTDGRSTHSLFMGYAPYDEPEIAVVVALTAADCASPAQQLAGELIAAYKELQ